VTVLEETRAAPSPPSPPSPRRVSRRRTFVFFLQRHWLSVAVFLVLLYLIIGPVGMLVLSSFQRTQFSLPFGSDATWSLDNYRGVFGESRTWHVFGTTMIYALGSLAVASVVSVGAAWLIERSDVPGRRLLYVIVVAGAGIPGLVYAISWNLLLNPTTGVVNQAIDAVGLPRFNVQSLTGMILVEGIRMVPIMFLLVSATLRGMDGTMEDAAAASGARPRSTLWRVTIPLLSPALIAALIYNFVNAVEWIDVPLILGLPARVTVLSTQVYLSVHPAVGLPNYGASSTYGMLLVVVSVIPLLVYQRIIGRSSRYATTTGRGYRPRRVKLGRWRRPAFAVMCGYGFITFAMPLAVMVWASVQPYYSGFSRAALGRSTLSAYGEVFHSPSFSNAVRNTLTICVCVAVVTMLLSLYSSRVIVRSNSRATAALDFLVFFPHLIPSVVVGLAILLIYLVLPIPIYGTIWIVVIAMVTKTISLGTRLTTPALAQIHVSLEEAGASSGARPFQVWRRTLLPLLRPVLTNGLLMIFVVTAQNLTLALMLISPGNSVLSTLIYNYWDLGLVGPAMAVSTLLTALTATAAIALRGTEPEDAD
jgi:iron(III) transport system permease protein